MGELSYTSDHGFSIRYAADIIVFVSRDALNVSLESFYSFFRCQLSKKMTTKHDFCPYPNAKVSVEEAYAIVSMFASKMFFVTYKYQHE